MKKRVLALLLALCMLLCAAPAALAAEGESGLSYVALGDSIAAGYGLPGFYGNSTTPAGGFPTRVASSIAGCELTDLAISGWDTATLIKAVAMEAYTKVIREADIISVTIGSNDLLLPAVKMLAEFFGVEDLEGLKKLQDSLTGTDMMTKAAELNEYFNSAEAAAVFNSAVALFKTNWDKLIGDLRRLNPDADVVVTSYYNPYARFNFGTVMNIGSLGQSYIDKLNEYIAASRYNGSYYVIADISDVSTNVTASLTDFSVDGLDPHPDLAGHAMIAKAVLEKFGALNDKLEYTLEGAQNFKRDKAEYAGFDDVSESSWFGAEKQGVIKAAVELGIVGGKGAMPGVGESCFDPAGSILICEAIKMASIVNSTYYFGEYVGDDEWYSGYVDYAIAHGIVKDGDFADYTAAATRAEMAYIFANSLPASEFLAKNTVTYDNIPDVGAETKYGDCVLRLYNAGVLSGDAGTFAYRPDDAVNRAEAAAIITRVAVAADRQILVFS